MTDSSATKAAWAAGKPLPYGHDYLKSGVVRSDPPRTWRVGRLLDTPANRMMAPQDRAYHEDIESRSVYESFTVEDAGRGRRHIATYDTPAEAERVARRHNRELAKFSIPRALAFWTGPIGPAAWQWTLAIGWRPDLSRPFDVVPARFAVEVTHRMDMMARADRRPTRPRWRIRFRSDFDLIERRIQYRAVARHLVNQLVNGNVTRWTLASHEERLERVYTDIYGAGWRFQYGDGNYSCDCNRYLFFERAGGRGLGDDDPIHDDRGCGETDYVVERIVRVDTGEVLIEGDPRG